MPTNNPYRLGELSKFYWIINNDYDTTQPEATILADPTWEEMCIVSATKNAAVTTVQIKDRCTARRIKSSYGRTELSLSISFNQFRLTPAQKRAIDAVIQNQHTISVLLLTDERTNDETFGIVGNFILESADEEQPEEGNNTESYTLKESALSLFDAAPVYGAAFV